MDYADRRRRERIRERRAEREAEKAAAKAAAKPQPKPLPKPKPVKVRTGLAPARTQIDRRTPAQKKAVIVNQNRDVLPTGRTERKQALPPAKTVRRDPRIPTKAKPVQPLLAENKKCKAKPASRKGNGNSRKFVPWC